MTRKGQIIGINKKSKQLLQFTKGNSEFRVIQEQIGYDWD